MLCLQKYVILLSVQISTSFCVEVVLLLLCIQVYLNALGLLLRVYLRGELDIFEDRLKTLASCITDQVSYMCISVRTIEKVTSQSMSDVCLQFDLLEYSSLMKLCKTYLNDHLYFILFERS